MEMCEGNVSNEGLRIAPRKVFNCYVFIVYSKILDKAECFSVNCYVSSADSLPFNSENTLEEFNYQL